MAEQWAPVSRQPGQSGPQAQPGQPVQPGQSGQVGQSGQPGQPGPQAQPGQPVQPGQSGHVGQSGQPGQPGQPGRSGHLGKSGRPGQSGQPGPQAQRGQPGAPARRGRAGRNLPAALGVGIGLGAVVLGTLYTYRLGFVALLVLVIAVAIWELVRAASRVEARPPLVPLLVGGVAMDALAWYRGSEALAVAFLLTAVACLTWRLADGPVGYLADTCTAIFIALYVPFLAGFAVLLTVPDDGARRVVTFIATVVCSDVGGYAAGVFLGRHPMAPTVSPRKSWEGFAGSVLVCVGAGAIFLPVFFHAPTWQGAVYGLAIAVTATLGDLGESMIKRDLGIKDMGSILPGHGGVMDRLDSLLPAAAVAYLLLTAFASPG